MFNKDLAEAKALIEKAKALIDAVNVKGSAASKNKAKAKKALEEASNAILWMDKINGNGIVNCLDKMHGHNGIDY